MTDRPWRALFLVLSLWLAVMGLPLCAGQDIGLVRSGDSLWKIAARIASEAGLSRDQVMLALLEANPEAFTPSCNVNGILRVGIVLRVPSVEGMGALDMATARRGIERQTREWAEHRQGGRPMVCPAVVDQPPPAPSIEPGNTLDEACPCPPDLARAEPLDQPGPTPTLAGGAPRTESSEVSPQLPEGPLGPIWLLIPLMLGLLAVSLVRRWAPMAATLLEQSGVAATTDLGATTETAALPSQRAPFLLALQEGDLVFLLLASLTGLLGALVTVLFREGIHGLEWLLVVRFINIFTYYTILRSNFFQRKTTGAAFISAMP